MIERCKANLFHKKTNNHQFIYEPNWMDFLLNDEELPAYVQRVTYVVDKPKFEIVYN